jgi:hypothetical protein
MIFFIILQNHRQLPVSIYRVKIAVLGSLKRVTVRTFKICKNFQEFSKKQAKTFRSIFSSTKKQKIEKTINAFTGSTYLFLQASFKLNIHLVTQSL